jgi:adenylate cyclase class IV
VSEAAIHEELELKAVVPDPDALRLRLLAGGAELRFSGRMCDRRYERPGGELGLRDQVLRLRTFHRADGHATAILGWKGPVERSPEGYKRRAEIELPVTGGDRGAPHALLTALGYEVVHAIDREVEVFELEGATLRIERYPRMDPLLEIEGSPVAIERAVATTGIPRAELTGDSLTEFVRRYELRSGRSAALALP